MLEQKKQTRLWSAISISAIILVVVVIWRVAFFKPAPKTQIEHHHEHPLLEPLAESTRQLDQPKMRLNDVIKAATTWQPAFTSWFGKSAPDFTLTDITGKQHKLSDYRGKSVLIVFWATWCGPCLMEIPHLIALRNTISEDELAILAISYITPRETAKMVKNFAERNKKINYTVFSSDIRTVTTPFNAITSIPCSFFIDTEGKIKLATVGTLSLGSIKAILQAEWP